jgi:hypothetical protein
MFCRFKLKENGIVAKSNRKTKIKPQHLLPTLHHLLGSKKRSSRNIQTLKDWLDVCRKNSNMPAGTTMTIYKNVSKYKVSRINLYLAK